MSGRFCRRLRNVSANASNARVFTLRDVDESKRSTLTGLHRKSTDDEIAAIVAARVRNGEIRPEYASMYAKALQDEANGDGVVMRDPGIRPRSNLLGSGEARN